MSGDSSLGIGIGLALKSYGRAFRGLLNQYPGAAAAYSLRKLSSSTSNVVRVRRSLDDAEQDFTAAEVSDGTLVNFANNGTSALYGERMYFDGVDDYIELDSLIALDLTNTWELEADVIISDLTGVETIFGSASPSTAIRVEGGKVTAAFGGFSEGTNAFRNTNVFLTAGTLTNVKVTWDGVDTVAIFIDGVEQASSALTSPSDSWKSGLLQIGIRIGANNPFNGSIFNAKITVNGTLLHKYQGYGNTDADWEDQIGSNNGTVNGSPTTTTVQVQGDTGFVSKWYDQSGNTNHAVQTTPANQPTIVEGGSLVTGGIDFDGVDDYLDFSNIPLSDVFSIFNNSNIAQAGSILGLSSSNSDYIRVLTSDLEVRVGATTNSFDFANPSPGLKTIIRDAGDDIRAFINGVESSTGSISNNGASEFNRIGARNSALNPADGTFAELIIYDTDQSDNRTAIEANIGEYYGITGIPAYDNTVDGFVET